MPRSTEFFRHLRPQWFDAQRLQLVPEPRGGVSFLLVPVAEGRYDFWLNICPMTAPFSAKQAVAHLRRARQAGTAPWGTVTLDDRPIIQQLCEATHRSPATGLPAISVSRQLRLIECINAAASRHAERLRPKSVLGEYNEADQVR